jgi:hypothetical protein
MFYDFEEILGLIDFFLNLKCIDSRNKKMLLKKRTCFVNIWLSNGTIFIL